MTGLKGHTRDVIAVTVINASTVVSGSYDTTLRVWDVETGACVLTDR